MAELEEIVLTLKLTDAMRQMVHADSVVFQSVLAGMKTILRCSRLLKVSTTGLMTSPHTHGFYLQGLESLDDRYYVCTLCRVPRSEEEDEPQC